MSIVKGVVAELESRGLTGVYADRLWHEPLPGQSVIVVRSESTWSATRTTAETPLVKVLIYSAPTDGQTDAEEIGEPVTAEVRKALHRVQGGMAYWGDQRVIQSLHVGSSLAEVEGHESWRVRTLTFEVLTA